MRRGSDSVKECCRGGAVWRFEVTVRFGNKCS